jgi:hypothetical protein
MASRRVIAALFLSQLLVGAAFAQSVVPPAGTSDASVASPAEFGRAYGGDLDLLTKHGQAFSGSFGMSTSRSSLPFATGTTKGLDATLGGTVLQDRLWVFASAHQTQGLLGSPFATTLPQGTTGVGTSRGIDTKVTAQLGDRQSLAASFAATRGTDATSAATIAVPNPSSSFLSLHYTGIVSSNMFFTGSFSRRNATQPELSPFIQPQ